MNTLFSKEELAKALIEWYSKNKCVYPWRYTNDPFLVLVSEFFLQQTKSDDVVEPYKILLGKYKSILELANADITFLREIFSKLGLFYRAERLVSAARFIKSEFSGEIPNAQDKLLSIPGIGLYSANAILCFGFGKKVGIADANVIRIYSRVYNLKSKTSRPRYDRNLWKFANEALPEKQYVDFNYSLLDFGKLICTFRNPKCTICPLNNVCNFYSDRNP